MKIYKGTEGQVEFYYYPGVPSKKQEVFYNPKKKLDRDLSVIFGKSYFDKRFIFCDLLAGTGVRAIRIAVECENCKEVFMNDINPKAYELMQKNYELNKEKIKNKKVNIFCEEARKFLENTNQYFDWIDIDPFGSPIPFILSTIRKIGKNGILSVTATDCGTLHGKYPVKTLVFYNSFCRKEYFRHEIGIRNLIRKIIDIGVIAKKVLIPIFAHASEHYYRVYFKINLLKRKEFYKFYLENIGYIVYDKNSEEKIRVIKLREIYEENKINLENFFGPTYLGKLWDEKLVEKMYKNSDKYEEAKKLLEIIKEEAKIDSVLYYDTNIIAKEEKLRGTPSVKRVIESLKKLGYSASRTHFSYAGFRTNAPYSKILEICKKIEKETIRF